MLRALASRAKNDPYIFSNLDVGMKCIVVYSTHAVRVLLFYNPKRSMACSLEIYDIKAECIDNSILSSRKKRCKIKKKVLGVLREIHICFLKRCA